PLHQNYTHVKTLESSLNVNADNIFSVVVFVGDSTFKTEMPENVTHAGELFSFINSKTEVLLSNEEVENIIQTIKNGRLSKSFKTHKEHTMHVKNIAAEKKYKTVCPKCNNDLVLRVAKRGANIGKEFYGCSRYPKCRYTKQVI
ncbi:MAG: topoisomerase DNA-binding C4 zinc finger domain-containing protein, partial [Candidatus Cloacimonadota bacterium]|nr:topoisomerase DNA-binding C4 zinc finger domain-containing protein [Candidatus Cloacimonadota bacterium]